MDVAVAQMWLVKTADIPLVATEMHSRLKITCSDSKYNACGGASTVGHVQRAYLRPWYTRVERASG